MRVEGFLLLFCSDLCPAPRTGLEHSRCPIKTEKEKAVLKGPFGPPKVVSNQQHKEQLARLDSVPTSHQTLLSPFSPDFHSSLWFGTHSRAQLWKRNKIFTSLHWETQPQSTRMSPESTWRCVVGTAYDHSQSTQSERAAGHSDPHWGHQNVLM